MTRTSRLVALVAGLLLSGSAGAQELADLNKPITIDLPGLELPFVTSLQPRANWPLVIRLLANKPLGYVSTDGDFPTADGAKGTLVWADPDGAFAGKCMAAGTCPPPTNATYLEFTRGPSSQGSSGSPLLVNCYTGAGRTHCPVGPPAGGYGQSSALPGLVVLSNTGVGREFTLDPASPVAYTGALQNLAGFVDSVTWTVNDHMPFLARTSVVAQMVVPYGLFIPLVFSDKGPCRLPNGLPTPCPPHYSIEGTFAYGGLADALAARDAFVTTLRIFVLDGPAPNVIRDMNHDGVIDARDALLLTNPVSQKPYRLLSGERVVRFKTLEYDYCPGLDNWWFDWAGQGTPSECDNPQFSGGIAKVPP
jgi:hypothetical protein